MTRLVRRKSSCAVYNKRYISTIPTGTEVRISSDNASDAQKDFFTVYKEVHKKKSFKQMTVRRAYISPREGTAAPYILT